MYGRRIWRFAFSCIHSRGAWLYCLPSYSGVLRFPSCITPTLGWSPLPVAVVVAVLVLVVLVLVVHNPISSDLSSGLITSQNSSHSAASEQSLGIMSIRISSRLMSYHTFFLLIYPRNPSAVPNLLPFLLPLTLAPGDRCTFSTCARHPRHRRHARDFTLPQVLEEPESEEGAIEGDDNLSHPKSARFSASTHHPSEEDAQSPKRRNEGETHLNPPPPLPHHHHNNHCNPVHIDNIPTILHQPLLRHIFSRARKLLRPILVDFVFWTSKFCEVKQEY